MRRAVGRRGGRLAHDRAGRPVHPSRRRNLKLAFTSELGGLFEIRLVRNVFLLWRGVESVAPPEQYFLLLPLIGELQADRERSRQLIVERSRIVAIGAVGMFLNIMGGKHTAGIGEVIGE